MTHTIPDQWIRKIAGQIPRRYEFYKIEVPRDEPWVKSLFSNYVPEPGEHEYGNHVYAMISRSDDGGGLLTVTTKATVTSQK